MSSRVEYRCDSCALTMPEPLVGTAPKLPAGWKQFEERDLCGYPCVIAYAEKALAAEQDRWAKHPFNKECTG